MTFLVLNSYFCNLTPFEIGYSLYATLLKCSVVPEVLEVQVVPSEEVRMVPLLPTATKILFAYVPPGRLFEVPEVLLSQVVPSEEVRMVPLLPNATNKLFS